MKLSKTSKNNKLKKENKENYPFVSILTPSLNEDKYLGECLDSLLAQDYPPNKFEILIADGNSTDESVPIIKKYMKEHKNIKLFSNPSKNTAIARNICLDNAKGGIVINSSSHIIAQKNFIRTLALRLTEADNSIGGVGCSNISPEPNSFLSRSIAIVFSSFFGGVKSFDQNLSLKKERIVRSIAFTAYRKELLKSLGGFDPKFWVGQDGELNLRLNNFGYTLLYTPKTYVTHHKRNTVKKFINQMYRYGIARWNMLRKHPKSFRLVFLGPMMFVLVVLGVLIYTLLTQHILLLKVCMAAYFLLSWGSALSVSKNIPAIIASPFFYFIEHISYGVGFIRGMVYGKINRAG